MTTSPKLPLEMETLDALGFGPDTLLLSEPKMFMNGRFLAALLAELEDELEPLGAQRALFQIGLLFGLRDAFRVNTLEQAEPNSAVASSTLLAIQFSQGPTNASPDVLEMRGTWPERYEADARLSKLGPDPNPSCALSAGYTSGWLSGTLERDILVVEETCSACGNESCTFAVHEVSALVTRDSAASLRLLPELAYETFRDISRNFALLPAANVSNVPPIDFDPTMIHVWGPVMVLPFTNVDEALHTVEMLGRDPETSGVRTVVVDLQGQGLDEGFTAAALEQILEMVGAWGAEAILTNVSPLAEPIVADLEVRHLLLRKDLPEAIAAAFQIAEAQRHLL